MPGLVGLCNDGECCRRKKWMVKNNQRDDYGFLTVSPSCLWAGVDDDTNLTISRFEAYAGWMSSTNPDSHARPQSACITSKDCCRKFMENFWWAILMLSCLLFKGQIEKCHFKTINVWRSVICDEECLFHNMWQRLGFEHHKNKVLQPTIPQTFDWWVWPKAWLRTFCLWQSPWN